MVGLTAHSEPSTDLALVSHLPTEMQHEILDFAGFSARDRTMPVASPKPFTSDQCLRATDLLTPSRNPLATFLKLPTELRSQIYQYLLPDRNKVVIPSTEPKEGTQTRTLMVLNHQICAEISVILYEGYTFAVDVHEGVTEGGIEFLNSGRQRLQYREHFSQVRFKRFEGDDDAFGFHRIKRLQIDVHHAAPEKVQKRKSIRHDPMHTHFMMLALVKLLQHSDGNFALNYLKICFVEGAHYRSPTVEVTQHWFHRSTKAPLSTSIHGVSNVEIITRPLMMLRRVQQTDFKLHPLLFQNEHLSNFIDSVSTIITSNINAPVIADELDSKIEHARDLLDAWLYRGKINIHSASVAGLGASDFMDIDQDSWDSMLRDNDQASSENFDGVYGSSLLPDEDGYFDLPGSEIDLADLKRMNADATSTEGNAPLTYDLETTYEMRTMSARGDIQEAEDDSKGEKEKLRSKSLPGTPTPEWKAEMLRRRARSQSQRRHRFRFHLKRDCKRSKEVSDAAMAYHDEEYNQPRMKKDPANSEPTKTVRQRAARFTGSYTIDEDGGEVIQDGLD